ncbi:hypothetical protein BV898_10256 [Hypsibius exemplaris]|uniref:CAS1 domain-containing protein 1 n=1 Tax=Hypsibius exemplaris TaxID=2072580 RepID=A0A1W0WK08_HYPEX|nr:hypothetical protein BV898_10256 [Hypsibius exemplaris]
MFDALPRFFVAVFVGALLTFLWGITNWDYQIRTETRDQSAFFAKLNAEVPCRNLLTSDAAINENVSSSTASSLNTCDLRTYSQQEALRCMKKFKATKSRPAHFAFIGDSRIRQLRDGIRFHLTGVEKDWLSNASVKGTSDEICKHENQQTTLWRVPIRLDFFWAPKILMAADVVRHALLPAKTGYPKSSIPDVVIVGCGIWRIQTCIAQKVNQTECFQEYKRDFLELLSLFKRITSETLILWVPQNLLTVKASWSKDADWYSDASMNTLNDAIRTSLEVAATRRVVYWKTFEKTFKRTDSLDGIHLGPQARWTDVQILFNVFCNDVPMR